MSKIQLDKYYTSDKLAQYCVEKTKEVIGENNISQYLEPSAGAGGFLNYLDNYLAYDIEPNNSRIIKQDYLKLELEYKKGRCIIGNPPYGSRNTLSVQFYKKSVTLSDYIAFILPISQYNNIQQMYEFDLIYSEDLGKQQYTGKTVHCCFNIYKRHLGYLNKKPIYKLKDIKIKEYRRGSSKIQITKENYDYDIAIKAWGGSPIIELSTLGKEIEYEGQYALEFYIKIYKFRDDILKILRNINWQKVYIMTATPKLNQWQIYKYLKEQIPNIQ